MESIANWIEPYVLSQKTVHEARCLFMHAHMVSSMAKYKSRLVLFLTSFHVVITVLIEGGTYVILLEMQVIIDIITDNKASSRSNFRAN